MPAAEETSPGGRQRRLFLLIAAAAAVTFAIIAVLLSTQALEDFDARIVAWFASHPRDSLTAVATALDGMDNWWLLAPLLAVLIGALWYTGRMVQAVYLAATAAVALVLNPILKLLFLRPRPDSAFVATSSYAFPSGHTTTATAIATTLALIAWPTRWRWPVVAAAVLFPLAMAWSRVYLGTHWPSDVAAGLFLGLAVALFVRLLMPWPTPAEAAEARGDATPGISAAGGDARADAAPQGGQTIDVVLLDWGNTLMVDNGMREGPMKDWETVEAEAGAQEALTRLRARYRLVVATNAEDSPASVVRMALARVGLDELVDDVVSSADVGDHKPNYAFFRAALLREGEGGVPLDPGRAVMVGDGTTNDIAGGQRAGMRTIWYNPTKRRFPDGMQRPDAVIRKLTDLPAVVDRLAGVAPEKRSRMRRKADAAAAEAAAADAAAAAAAALRAATRAEDAAASAAAAIPNQPAVEPPMASPAPDDTPGSRDAAAAGG